ncbi:hypothetical protein K7X08_024037 [Anisodus acutangulus]|uniref:Uncharacterized protein n=1 Tax=Anisodus acutangulus TaxID=402998 RepID=A0A9Q1RFA4_9SOLA|nr:hypothetical protein K7X08_024037 [Anisodus acutangulus]
MADHGCAGGGYSWMQDNSASCEKLSTNGRKQGPLNAVSPTEQAQVSSVDDLYDFICSGPLINKIGLTPEKVAESIDKCMDRFRGNAGIRDLPLSVETLTALSKLTKEGVKMKIPRYNKSAYNGRGDRVDPSTWPEVEGPLPVGSSFYLEL